MGNRDRIDLKLVAPSDHQVRRLAAFQAFKQVNPRSNVTQDEFFEAYDLGFDTGHRLGYDNGFNDAQRV